WYPMLTRSSFPSGDHTTVRSFHRRGSRICCSCDPLGSVMNAPWKTPDSGSQLSYRLNAIRPVGGGGVAVAEGNADAGGGTDEPAADTVPALVEVHASIARPMNAQISEARPLMDGHSLVGSADDHCSEGSPEPSHANCGGHPGCDCAHAA